MTMRSGFERRDLVERHLVVAANERLRAQLAEVLHEVVGKRIVVVDDQNHSLMASVWLEPSQALLRQLQRSNQRLRLVLRLLVLGRRIRIGDDAGARLHRRARAR